MSVTFKFDSARFQKDFRERVARSKKTLPVITNTVSAHVNKVALDETKRADRGEIEQLGLVAIQFAKKRGGLLKRRKNIYATGAQILRATNIYIARLLQRGINPKSMSPGEIQKGVVKMIASRLSGVGSLAARFVPILKKLSVEIKQSFSVPANAKPKGKNKGRVDVAREGWSPICKWELSVETGDPYQSSESKERVAEILNGAISKGFTATSEDMEAHAKKQIDPIWRA